MIKIPIEIGDIVRVGRFKNKRVKVKSIEYDEYGLPIINGRPLLTMRIEKLMQPKQETIIKLKDILKELKSIQNIDKVDTTKQYTIIWDNGDLIAMTPETAPPMKFGKIFPMSVDPKKKLIKLQDYDDWSSFKDILKMQQAVKDMMRANLADLTWKVDIPMSDVKKNIGSLKIADFIQYDASFANVIPKAFHGTTSYDLENIKRLGIVPPSKHDNEILKWDSFYTEDSPDKVYLSTDFNRAEYYARHAAELYKKKKIKATPIVIQIDNLPTDRIVADDDFKSNMSMIQLIAAMQTGKQVDTDSYIQSIRGTSQFGYKGRIPASMFTKIHKV